MHVDNLDVLLVTLKNLFKISQAMKIINIRYFYKKFYDNLY